MIRIGVERNIHLPVNSQEFFVRDTRFDFDSLRVYAIC